MRNKNGIDKPGEGAARRLSFTEQGVDLGISVLCIVIRGKG